MKKIMLCILLAVVLAGCATIHSEVPVVMPDNTIKMASIDYTRWFNQSIEGFYLESPNGWIVGFDRQGAKHDVSFGIGKYKITVGDMDDGE